MDHPSLAQSICHKHRLDCFLVGQFSPGAPHGSDGYATFVATNLWGWFARVCAFPATRQVINRPCLDLGTLKQFDEAISEKGSRSPPNSSVLSPRLPRMPSSQSTSEAPFSLSIKLQKESSAIPSLR